MEPALAGVTADDDGQRSSIIAGLRMHLKVREKATTTFGPLLHDAKILNPKNSLS